MKKFCRWHNHLNPDIKKDAWTLAEEFAIMEAHRINGNKWAEMSKVLPGRYAYSHLVIVKWCYCSSLPFTYVVLKEDDVHEF